MSHGVRASLMLLFTALFLVLLSSAQSSAAESGAHPSSGKPAVSDTQLFALLQENAQGERVQISIDAPRLKTATFSPGVKVGKLLFISGQVSIDPEGNIVGRGDFAAQCRQVFENIKLVLDKAGASFTDIVKINAYLTDLRNYPVYSQIRGTYFKGTYPASTVVGTTGLVYEGLMLEVEAIAMLK